MWGQRPYSTMGEIDSIPIYTASVVVTQHRGAGVDFLDESLRPRWRVHPVESTATDIVE